MAEVAILDLNISNQVQRCVAQLRGMCTMTFPEDPKLRAVSEITYWAQWADLLSGGSGGQRGLARSSKGCPNSAHLGSDLQLKSGDSENAALKDILGKTV